MEQEKEKEAFFEKDFKKYSDKVSAVKEKINGHPPSTELVVFETEDGKPHHGFYVKDINKYIKNVNRWKDINTGQWFDDNQIEDWEMLETL